MTWKEKAEQIRFDQACKKLDKFEKRQHKMATKVFGGGRRSVKAARNAATMRVVLDQMTAPTTDGHV
jgi:hypothetical protein